MVPDVPYFPVVCLLLASGSGGLVLTEAVSPLSLISGFDACVLKVAP